MPPPRLYMEDTLEKIRQVNTERARQQLESARHNDLLDAQNQTQEMTVRSFQTLVEFMARHITKVEVLNQLREIATPDVLALIPVIESLQASVEAKEVDLTPVTALLQDVLDEAKQIPKEFPEEKEGIDYSDRFKALEEAIKTVTEAVKAQETTVEAPVVNVPETTVNVDAPDLKPLQKGFSDVVDAVRAIVIPEVTLDTSVLEKEQKLQTKLLKEIRDKPVGGGGGGGGRATPYQDSNGTPAFVELTIDGKIPVETGTTSVYESRFDTASVSGSVFLAKAVAGSLESDAAWQIKKVNISAGSSKFADAETTFTKVWDDRTSYTY